MSAARAHVSRLARAHPLRGRGLPMGALLGRIPPLAVAVALGIGLVAGLGWMWLRDASLVAVDRVEVTGATGPDADRIERALTRAGTSMTTLHVRPDVLRTAVSAFPLVRTIETEADFPHGLRVHVLLEHPAAALVAPGRRVAVTAGGKVLPRVPTAGLPTVGAGTAETGARIDSARVRGAVAALGAAPGPLRPRIEDARWTRAKGLVVALRDGPDLVFGSAARIAAKWLSATRVLADPTSRGARYVDVRVPERPAAGGVATGDPAPATTTPAVPAPVAPVTPATTVPAAPTQP